MTSKIIMTFRHQVVVVTPGTTSSSFESMTSLLSLSQLCCLDKTAPYDGKEFTTTMPASKAATAASLKLKAAQHIEVRRGLPKTYTTPIPNFNSEREKRAFQNAVVKKYFYPYSKPSSTSLSRNQKKILQHYPAVKEQYEALVEKENNTVSAQDFWERYEYRCGDVARVVKELQAHEERKNPPPTQDALLAAAMMKSSSSKSGWKGLLGSGKNKKKEVAKKKHAASKASTAKGVEQAKEQDETPKQAPPSPPAKSIASTAPNTPDRSILQPYLDDNHIDDYDSKGVLSYSQESKKEAMGCWACFNFCQ